MLNQRPPTLDPQAAARWARYLPTGAVASPWLHEEVARRMEQRLQWIVKQPQRWLHWEPVRGGLQAQPLLVKRYPKSECYVLEAQADRRLEAMKSIVTKRWHPAHWGGAPVLFQAPTKGVQMLWANMALHMHPEPQDVIAQWQRYLEVDGFLMFSCLGPDTLRELRPLYAQMGWPAPSHAFTDMHDWGDMLVGAGFAAPVMDMERITLSFATPERLLQELRELGRNLNIARFPGLRGRAWHAQLLAGLRTLAAPGAPLTLTFEVIYGHAFKPPERLTVQAETTLSLEAMRENLQSNRNRRG